MLGGIVDGLTGAAAAVGVVVARWPLFLCAWGAENVWGLRQKACSCAGYNKSPRGSDRASNSVRRLSRFKAKLTVDGMVLFG